MAKDAILNKGMVPASMALEIVLEDAASVGSEMVDLATASGRVLAQDVISKRTQPPFAASAMDGYALRHEDILLVPVTLKLVGEAAAGHPFNGKIAKGECIRIFTGAPVPDSADTVVIQENASVGSSDPRAINILQSTSLGRFVRPEGLDFKEGEKLLNKGDVLDAQRLALCASMDHPEVCVCKRPIVAIIATGDELVLPGEAVRPGQIIASNTFGIAAIAQSNGADVLNLGIALDKVEHLSAIIKTAIDEDSDLIVTTGGASVGDHDLVKPVLQSFGFVFAFIKIAMRPGKPVIFGRAMIDGKERRFLGLAGNPVSSLVSSHIFMRPLVRLLGGYGAETVKPVQAVLGVDLPENDEREDFMRGKAQRSPDGTIIAEPFFKQDSSMLATLAKSDCLIIRPVKAAAAKAGDSIAIILLRDI